MLMVMISFPQRINLNNLFCVLYVATEVMIQTVMIQTVSLKLVSTFRKILKELQPQGIINIITKFF